MAGLSRSQILVYGAIAVALLLVGARWIRSAEADGPPQGGVEEAAAETGGGGAISFDGDGEDVVVHVAGAVREPGVYRLPAGSRVTDAVKRAGGATGEAGLDAVNLAAELGDGQQVILPSKSPTAASAEGAGTAATGPISLGSATLEQLDTVEGIGPVTAQNIIDFRTENGGISSVEDLDQISGIGPATMETLRSNVQP